MVRLDPTLEWSNRKVLHLGKLLALPTNIRLGCEGLQETNTLAYPENSLFTAVKSFVTLGPESLNWQRKTFHGSRPVVYNVKKWRQGVARKFGSLVCLIGDVCFHCNQVPPAPVTCPFGKGES